MTLLNGGKIGIIQAIPLKKDSLLSVVFQTIVHCPTGMSNFPLRQKQPPSLFPKKVACVVFLSFRSIFTVRFFKETLETLLFISIYYYVNGGCCGIIKIFYWSAYSNIFLNIFWYFLGTKLMCLEYIFGDFQWKMMFGFKSFYFLRTLCSLDGAGHFGNGQCRK